MWIVFIWLRVGTIDRLVGTELCNVWGITER